LCNLTTHSGSLRLNGDEQVGYYANTVHVTAVALIHPL